VNPKLLPSGSDVVLNFTRSSTTSGAKSKKSSELFSVSDGLPKEGYVRLKQILAPRGPIPCSPATWWAGVKSGRFPQPTKFFGERITAWNVDDIRELLRQAASV
jgi:predicted DNA-binding transcriptional regulator AlpA